MTPLDRLAALPKLSLRGFTSPVQLLERFSEAVGAEIWCKRDDIGSIGLAGNKVRKLEVELAHAVDQGAEHLVIEGSRLSNAARAVAAAAAVIGVKCTLVLSHDEPRTPVGNLMLDGLFGAELHFVGDASWAELAGYASDVVEELRGSGVNVHRLPIGCASDRSCLGFATAFVEMQDQMRAHDKTVGSIVHASSSGGTHAGLTLGKKLTSSDADVLWVIVAPDVYEDVTARYLSFAQGGARILGAELELTRADINLTDAYLGEGYGLPADGVMEAVDLLARTEGIVVDPVYSAKAVAAVIDLAGQQRLVEPIVFWHTGGMHALFDPHFAKRAWSEIPRLAAIDLGRN